MIADYFNVFPSQSDEGFTRAISSKEEFRELSHYGFTNNLFNNQELVVRLLKPGTGIHAVFLDSYMGTGKTRTGLKVIENWRDIMTNNPLLLSPGGTIEAVHVHEIRQLYGNLTKTEINRRYRIQHYASFTNEIRDLLATDHGEEKVRAQYGNCVIFADEIHTLRTANESKESYNIFNRFIHLVMDSCIVMLATGTIMVDNAAEINLINLILPESKQIKKEVIGITSNASSSAEIMPYFRRYFPGYLLYFNQDPSMIPPIEMLGENYVLNDGLTSKSPIVTHDMGEYQAAIYVNEVLRSEDSTNKMAYRMRYALNFVFPNDNGKDPLEFSQHAISYMGKDKSSSIGEFIDRKWARSLKDITTMRIYGRKFADIIEDIIATPDVVRFVFLQWVDMGVVVFGILLELMGYKYYSGFYPLNPAVSSKTKRYAVISESTSVKQINAILNAANMIENKYGEYLQVIVGSPKAEEGISLTNARHIDITQADWHRSGTQQAIHRVIRINSLNFFDKQNAKEYKISVAQHASISTNEPVDPFTQDIKMFFISDLKYNQISYVTECESNLCINTYLSSYRNKNVPDAQYSDLAVDYSSYLLGGYGKNVEELITYRIKETFAYRFSFERGELKTIVPDYPLMASVKVLGDMIQYNTILRDRWGLECFVRLSRDTYYLQYGTTVGTNTSSASAIGDAANQYYGNHDRTVFEFIRPELLASFIEFVDENDKLSDLDFRAKYLELNMEMKIVSLEAILVDTKLIPKRIRRNILGFMRNNWFIPPGRSCVSHILEQINIDRVHYTANVSNLHGTGKVRIYCYEDAIPRWRFANTIEQDSILQYANSVRAANEAPFASRSPIYGILNTTDNELRIKDTTIRKDGSKEEKKKSKGYICIDAKKDIVIPILHRFGIQPPQDLVEEYGNAKTKEMQRELSNQKITLPPNSSKETIRFYYIWIHGSMPLTICEALQSYFTENDLLFIK